MISLTFPPKNNYSKKQRKQDIFHVFNKYLLSTQSARHSSICYFSSVVQHDVVDEDI